MYRDHIRNKVIIVTGASRGFGRAMAYTYAVNGAKVAAVALEKDELENFSQKMKKKNIEILTIPKNLSKKDDIYDIKKIVIEKYGRVDVLVNNAAISQWKNIHETTLEEWDKTFAVNIRAPFLLSKILCEKISENNGGSIINITSRSAEIGFISEIAFSPTKWALEGLTQCLAMELQPLNIAVNALKVAAPEGKRLKPTGLTLKDSLNQPEHIREKYATEEEMEKAFAPAWIFLASQNANGVTGQRLRSKKLSEYIRKNGWDSAIKLHGRKLTEAIYTPYKFPKSSTYQTPDGEYNTLKYKFKKGEKN